MTTEQPLIVLAGHITDTSPAWAESLQTQLESAYRFSAITAREGYVPRLADDMVALVLVDGADAAWRYWTTTPKSSAATRRIPVFVVSDDADLRADALVSGADLAFSTADILKDGIKQIAAFARVFDPLRAEQLDCDCDESLPDLAEQGFAKFNAGEYYAQHDLFEELWVETESPVRDLYRAILQVGVAYYQIERGNHRGARKMLLRSVQWLAVLPDVCQGIDVKALRDDSTRVRAALERLPEDQIDQFDHTLIQPVKRVSS